MSEAIKVVYGGTEIAYIEREDKWRFELRGRERSSDSLAKAKEAIDAPPPKDKKAFERIKAFKYFYGDRFQPVEITSLAENTYGSRQYVWISADGQRSKESVSVLYGDTPENRAAISEYEKRRTEINVLGTANRKTIETMTTVTIDGCE